MEDRNSLRHNLEGSDLEQIFLGKTLFTLTIINIIIKKKSNSQIKINDLL